MKNLLRISGVILIILLIHSCDKEKLTPPSVTTTAVTDISYTTAASGGVLTDEGSAPVVSRGVCWSTTADPTITNSKTIEIGVSGAFTSNLTLLTQNTTYYVRAYATNIVGTGYGNQVSFITSRVEVPVLTTAAITSITQTSAVSGGNIITNNGGSVTASGVCWSTSAIPTIGNSKTTDGSATGSFTSSISGLSANTAYYVRAYATNSAGTGYGNELILKTYTGTVTDIDGNVYNTVTIGTQVWMAENLKTTRYRNEDLIGTTTPATLNIYSEITPKYQWAFGGNESNATTYGRLYTWYAVTDIRNVCPTGWHVPTNAEWTSLTTYLGGESIAGGKLKETGTTHWLSPNTGATNESGFTALPAGFRFNEGQFTAIGYDSDCWSSTENDLVSAWSRYIPGINATVSSYVYSKANGLSVRCVKD